MGKISIDSRVAAKIYINNKEQGVIKRQTKDYELENGVHQVWAKSAWCGSQKLNVEINEDTHLHLTLNSFSGEAVIKSIFFLLMGLFIYTKNKFLGIFVAIFLMYPLYYITIGRNKYLELTIKK